MWLLNWQTIFMWLLDANMDVHLAPLLKELGMECDTASARGWQKLINGELVKIAVESGFTCLLTHDRLFGETAARALKSNRNFSVVVIHLPQKPWKLYQEDFRSAWIINPIKTIPGKILHWPTA